MLQFYCHTRKLKKTVLLPAVKTIKPLFYLIYFLLPSLATGQTGLWQTVANTPINLGSSVITPQKYLLLKLDAKMMKGVLNTAPMQNAPVGQNSNTLIDIPMPDGSMKRFVIVESPIMEPSLAQQFPDIKTYSGYSVDNPVITARLDFTPAGFHAMIFSPDGTFFIDPFNKATLEYYICYNKKDYIPNKTFRCGVGSPALDSINTQKKTNEPLPKLDLPTKVGARIGDGARRRYRLALAATGEYTAFHGGTVAQGLAAQVTTMNRVNGIFMVDFAVDMILVANNNLLVYTNAATDPYTNGNPDALLSQNATNLNAVIGSANYDIGHVFSTGGGGLAGLGVVCNSDSKAWGETGSNAPVGDAYDVDYVAHEMGHQFGGNHSFNNSCGGNRNNATAFEPGSGSTIMSYAGICTPDVEMHSDSYFHGGNLSEMYSFITGAGNTCAVQLAYGNVLPVITAYTANQTIPKGTPILLESNATDADGNASLTYCWEQMNNGIDTQPPTGSATVGPVFRSFPPSVQKNRYLPRLSDLVNNITPTWEVLPQVARTLNFRLVVRDNFVSGGGANDHTDVVLTVTASAGPFVVTLPNETGISWPVLSTRNVTWDVANTNLAPVSCTNVDILLSIDGGLTYPNVLASNVPNNGSASITVPNISTSTARVMVRGTGKAFFDISNNNFSITGCSPVTPTVAAASRCGTGEVTLTAAGCSGGTIDWYTSATGGTSIHTGTSFNTPDLPTTTTYYVTCTVSNCTSARVSVTATINVNPTFSGSQTAGTYRASQTIASTANVATGTNYYAGKSIQLNPGFQAGSSEVFLAKIEDCP